MRSPWGRTACRVAGAAWGPGLTVTAVEGSHVPGSVCSAAVVVSGGWMTGSLEMGMFMRVWTGSCWVAASVVAAVAGRRGARVVVRGGSWFGLGLGLGGCRLRCRRCFCGVGGCAGWCWWWSCCCWCGRLGFGLGLGSGFGFESGSRFRWTSVRRCEGTIAGLGRVPACCRGAWGACVGVGGLPVAWRAAPALAVWQVGGEGGVGR